MLEWLKDNVLSIIVFAGSLIGAILVGYKQYILLEVRVATIENKTISFEKEIKEGIKVEFKGELKEYKEEFKGELKEIKEDIKKLLARD